MPAYLSKEVVTGDAETFVDAPVADAKAVAAAAEPVQAGEIVTEAGEVDSSATAGSAKA